MLKHPLRLALLLSTVFTTLSAQAAYWSPHVGVDAIYWGVKPTFQYEDLYPRINKGINLYVGSRVNGYFGFDIGYEQSSHKQKGQVFKGGEILFVTPETVNDAATVDIRLRTFHLDLNFYWEVARRFEIIFMLGVANLTPSTHLLHLTNGVWTEFKNESPHKAMGRFGLGAQLNFTPCFALKGLIQAENGIRIKYTGFDEDNNLYDFSPYNATTTYKLGVVYSFSPYRRHRPQ